MTWFFSNRSLLTRLHVGLIIAFCINLSACGSAVPDRVKAPSDTAYCTEQDSASCQGQRESQIAEDDEGADYDDASPPHKFVPRSHPPHRWTSYTSHPDLMRLPKLKMRYSACFRTGPPEAQLAQPYPMPRKSVRAPKGKKSSASGLRRRSKPPSKSAAGGIGLAESAPAPSAPAADMAVQSAKRESAKESMGKAPMEVATDEEAEPTTAEEEPATGYDDWGAKIYLSNDDTMSLSSAQRVIFAIDNFLPLPLAHIRPHELLNYFSFQTAAVSADRDFSVQADIEADPREEGIYTLALAVRGRPVDRASRRNANLTLVIDRSGSMSAEGRMSYLKRGLKRMVEELKKGDIVHMVLFDHEICTPIENFVVGRDDRNQLYRTIEALAPMGSTDLHRGLTRGYEIADQAYQPSYSNRVIMITDAQTNTGVTNEQMIATISKYYESRKIRLSGVGVGRSFNDALLDRLTERGKGAYLFLGSEAEVDAVFGSRFISLIETTALDVHFRLHLPKSLRMNVFYGEESSTVKEDVQAIHYFANTSQLFLSDVVARGNRLRTQDDIMLSIEYQAAESDEKRYEEVAFNLGQIQGAALNVRKGRLIMSFIDLLARMAARPMPAVYRGEIGTWEDDEGYQICEEGGQQLKLLSRGIGNDAEVKRVFELWDKYCSRYERPRNPVRRNVVPQQDTWPSAQPKERR